VQSAERYRLRIIDDRKFDLSTNPALREENNISLVTSSRRDYDAVYIADEIGEYARYVPYQVIKPRPVIGATGLVGLEWHWALERYGAPQVNSRFEQMSESNRRMYWQDWSAWIATRAILTAFSKSRDPSIEAVNAYLRSHKLRLDGSKGRQMNFRPWNGQLRMPILLATHNAIIGIAPIEGFLHQTNTLDSIGADEKEFSCDR
jgi:ABC transporter substrate binding protein (PQQ-dependent alcohol dehydrogenase system)